MISWQELTAAAVLAAIALVLVLRAALAGAKDRKWRAAERKLTTVLQPKETVKAVCPQKKGRVILTSKRLLFETREGFDAVALKDIKKLQGTTKDKKNTTVAAKMVSLTVRAGKEYTITNAGAEFADLAGQLTAKVKKQNRKRRTVS